MTFTNYIYKNLWLQVVLSLGIGLGFGLILGDDVGIGLEDESLDFVASYLKIPASIFLSLIHMIIVPLIFCSIVLAISSLGSKDKLRSLGLGIGGYFVMTTTISITIAIILVSIVSPGSFLDITLLKESYDLTDTEVEIKEGFSLTDIPNAVASVIPKNPVTSYLEGQMLSILVFAMIVGLAAASLPKESVKSFLDVLESIQKITIHILMFSMKIVPFAVFGLIVGMVSKVGIESMVGMGAYMGTVFAGLGAMLLVYILILRFVAKRDFTTFTKFRNPQTLAFSTGSSMATMPVTLKTAEEELKADKKISKFVIPLGTTVNMDGTALYQVIAVFFLAQLFSIELSIISILVIIITTLLASIGTPAIPGAGVIVLSTILVTVGIPPVGIILLISVDRILDMTRTMVNVTGDLTATCVFDKLVGDPKTKSD